MTRDEEAERIYQQLELESNPPEATEIMPAAVKLLRQSQELMTAAGLYPGPLPRRTSIDAICIQAMSDGPTVYLLPSNRGLIVTTNTNEPDDPLPLEYDRRTESLIGPLDKNGTRRSALAIVAEAVRNNALGEKKKGGVFFAF